MELRIPCEDRTLHGIDSTCDQGIQKVPGGYWKRSIEIKKRYIQFHKRMH